MKRLIFALGLSAQLLQTAFAAWYQMPSYGYVGHNRCCHFYTEFEAGLYRLNMPPFSYGEFVDPITGIGIDPIPEFTFSNDNVNSFYPRLALGLEVNKKWCPCWIRDILFELGVFYLRRDVGPGIGSGVISDEIALPNPDGSNLLFGNATLSGLELKRNYEYGGVQFKLGSDLNFYHFPQFALTPYLEFDFDSLNQDYEVSIGSVTGATTPVGPLTNVVVREHVNTNYWDFGIGIDMRYAFSPCCKTFFVFAEGAAFVSHASSFLKARSSLTTATPTTTTTRFERNHYVLTGKARGQVGIGYQFGYNFMASVMGQVDYWDYVPRLLNPQRIATTAYDHPLAIGRSSATNYALIFSVNITFF